MSVETLALGLAKSVAKIVVGRWLAGRASKQAAGSELIDLVKVGVKDEFLQRRAATKFTDLALTVEQRLSPHFRQELRGLDDDTRRAAAHEVVRTLDAADLSDKALLGDDLNPRKLAKRVQAARPQWKAEFQLGEAGARLYEVLLEECCVCLAHMIVHLPEFSERAAAESLSRFSRVTADLEDALARLPVRTLDAPEGESLDDEFAQRYLASVIDNLDQLELFGVRMERLNRPRTTLSVAYISLNVTDEKPNRLVGPGREPVTIAEWRESRSGGAVRVEQALSEHKFMLLRGEAGSGKTTLLRWLAVSAAKGTFTGDLAPLNGYVPFLIKLRSHAGRRLPTSEEFLDDVAPEPARIMPKAWVRRQLLSGRALLLVDGIDEIVESQRREVRKWLGHFTREYPGVRVVVTSRPAAAEANWLKAEGFRSALLEPLNPGDLKELVRQWHLAIRDSGDLPCPAKQLPKYEKRLLARLELAPHLRTLASTPLLAAMLCALNLDRNSLPPDRMGLYADAIEMLLDKRDAQRGIPSAQNIRLERDQKLQILRALAWHLSSSDRVELSTDTAQRLTANRVAAMPQVQISGEDALNTLLQRSGVIREPVPGRIDFVHRTLQEYLTASHAAEIGDLDLLVGNAHLDRWRETIIMAAGHANRPQQAELIKGILARAKRVSKETRRKLQFLAAGCLETLPAVPEALCTPLDDCLHALIPPQHYDEASLLAAIGTPVLQLLPKTLKDLPPNAPEATIRTAGLINGPEALDVLRRYAADADGNYQYALGQMWDYFDPSEYADRVLSAMPPGKNLWVRSRAQLAVLNRVLSLSSVELDLPNASDLAVLPDLPSLRELRVAVPDLTDLGFLDSLPPLAEIQIMGCQDVSDYSPLYQSTALEVLRLDHCSQLRSLEQLPPLGEVTMLDLRGSKMDRGTLAALAEAAPKLVILGLHDCDWIDDVAPLAALPNLMRLNIRNIAPGTDLSPLAQREDLQVRIARGQDVRGADALGDRLRAS